MRIEKIFSGWGGEGGGGGGGSGRGVQIPRSGVTENFNMAKINDLAIPGAGGGGGGGGSPDPLSPLWIRP